MISLGTINIAAGVNTSFKAPPTGVQALVIGNESGLTCVVTLEGTGTQKTLYPGTVDVFPVGIGFSGIVFVAPSSLIGTAILYPGTFLACDAIGIGDNLNYGAYPMALPRPMTAGTTSPQSGYSNEASIQSGGSTVANFGVNIFNPVGSGIIARVYSLHVFALPSPTQGQLYNIWTRVDGTNNHFSNADDPAFQHNINGSFSKVTTTFNVATAIPTPQNVIQEQFYASGYFDYLGPPDCLYLNPGQNLLVTAPSLAINTTCFIGFKWTES